MSEAFDTPLAQCGPLRQPWAIQAHGGGTSNDFGLTHA
jgi:hypothetical protein